MRGAVREIAEEYRAQADAKGLETTVELPDELSLVESEPGRGSTFTLWLPLERP